MPLTPIVIEQTSKGERSYDIFSRLLKDRIIMLEGPIEEHTASVLLCSTVILGITRCHEGYNTFISIRRADWYRQVWLSMIPCSMSDQTYRQ